MAGGPFARKIACDRCRSEGLSAPAERVEEGSETDYYLCAQGHRFGVYWRQIPSEPMWRDPTREQVAEAAYLRWLGRGGGHGGDLDDWLRAERELSGERKYR